VPGSLSQPVELVVLHEESRPSASFLKDGARQLTLRQSAGGEPALFALLLSHHMEPVSLFRHESMMALANEGRRATSAETVRHGGTVADLCHLGLMVSGLVGRCRAFGWREHHQDG